MGADGEVVPASEVKALYQQIRELKRLLGKKTQEAEILREVAEVARGKKVARALIVIRDRRHPWRGSVSTRRLNICYALFEGHRYHRKTVGEHRQGLHSPPYKTVQSGLPTVRACWKG